MRPQNIPPPPPHVPGRTIALEVLMCVGGLFVMYGGLLGRGDTIKLTAGGIMFMSGIWMIAQAVRQNREYQRYLAKYPRYRPRKDAP